MLIIASSGMYLVEKDVQPEKFGSIPKAMWWSIVTLTTVGYGDVYPITSIGKVFGSITIILGIGTVALPSGILASAFTEHTRRNQIKYKKKLEFVLQDNVIDKNERVELRELAERLNLSDEDISDLEEHYKSKK
jgi:voltage-gated potassium channel